MQNRFRVAHARACVYWHQLKLQSVAGMQVAESIDMPAFMCDYFFNKYGMKRLVQVKLHELISSIKRYYHKDKRVRTCAAGLGVVSPAHTATTRCTTRWGLQVKFFARVCGLFEPVPTESFNFYLQAISILMLDILGVRSAATLAACMPQPTYKHGVSRRRARSANGSGSLLPTEAHGCQFEWRLQHASGTCCQSRDAWGWFLMCSCARVQCSLFAGQAAAFIGDLVSSVDALVGAEEDGMQRPAAELAGSKLVLLDSVLGVLLDVRRSPCWFA